MTFGLVIRVYDLFEGKPKCLEYHVDVYVYSVFEEYVYTATINYLVYEAEMN